MLLTFSMSCLRKSSMKALREAISFCEGRGPSSNTKSQWNCYNKLHYISKMSCLMFHRHWHYINSKSVKECLALSQWWATSGSREELYRGQSSQKKSQALINSRREDSESSTGHSSFQQHLRWSLILWELLLSTLCMCDSFSFAVLLQMVYALI